MPNEPPRVLIVESDPFIALDLAESIRDCGPADLSMAASPHEAALLLEGTARLCAAIVRAPVSAVEDSGLAAKVAKAGGRLLLVGASLTPEAARDRGWLVLDQPFTSATIEEALRAIGCARPAP